MGVPVGVVLHSGTAMACAPLASALGAALSAASALPLVTLRPNRSSRSSCTSARISDSSLARWNQSAKPGSLRCWAWNSRTVIMRSQSGIGTSTERPPASRNLRKACAVWFFLLGGKSLARSMKQVLSFMAGSTRSSWRLRPPPCVGRLHRKMRLSAAKPVSCRRVRSMAGSSSDSSSRFTVMFDRAAPFVARQRQRRPPARPSTPGRRRGSPLPTAP